MATARRSLTRARVLVILSALLASTLVGFAIERFVSQEESRTPSGRPGDTTEAGADLGSMLACGASADGGIDYESATIDAAASSPYLEPDDALAAWLLSVSVETSPTSYELIADSPRYKRFALRHSDDSITHVVQVVRVESDTWVGQSHALC